jgi:hypothetical protein
MRILKSGIWLALAFTAASSVFWAMGCKKDDVQPKQPPVLPAQPPVEPLTDEFQEPDSLTSPTPADPGYGQVANGPYTLQIQLLAERSAAVRVAEKLKALGIPAYVAEIVDPKPELPGTYYRVRAGSFATTAAAREYGRINLTPLGRDFWVDLKGRDSEPVHPVYKPRTAPAPAPAPQPKIVEPAPAAPAQPKIVEPAYVPPPPAPAAPKAAPVDPAIVPKDLEGKPALTDTGSVQDW